MSKWKCGICNRKFDNYQAQDFNGTIYCPLCYFKELYKRKKTKNDKAIDNCRKSIESINQKLQDDKTIKVVNGKVVNMNEYQVVRLKAIRMKCKELLEILGGINNMSAKKLNIGDYVRTKYGSIYKIDEIGEYSGNVYATDDTIIQGIIKSSSNIIDLIEVKDILEIKDMFGNISKVEVDENFKLLSGTIVAIITHERYEANKYKIGE